MKGAAYKMLELKNISFSAEEGGKTSEIIRGIDLDIPDNKFIVITGPNGGGQEKIYQLMNNNGFKNKLIIILKIIMVQI